ncbi:MAG: gephyrin-like molybdotransferase Glp [Dokdonella sp.]
MPISTNLEFATQLSVDEARSLVRELGAQKRMQPESVDLDNALGRTLAADMLVPHDLPPFANSAMDGYALRGSELPVQGETCFRVSGAVLAGAPVEPVFAAGECVRITTGAPLPSGADTVVIKENVRIDGDHIVVCAGELAGANVRPAGEDYRAGDVAMRSGARLGPAHLGVLAACGCTQVKVARRPRVALFVTGDELVPPDQTLAYGQIHDSNRYTLGAMLRELGIEPEPVAHLRDDADALRVALREAADRCDVVISSGGVSAGEADFLPGVVAELGKIHFWKVRMKPGMPLLCGDIGGALVFALPGNPVSTIATFLTLVRPALLAMQGADVGGSGTWKARLATPVLKKHDRCEFLRARVEARDDGAWWAMPLQRQGSGMLRGVVEADVLIVVPEHVRELAVGSVVEVQSLSGFC